MPSLSSVRTLSTCCLLVSGFFTEIAQQIHSLRARGVSSSHEALASASEARVFRKSSGNWWTTPPEMSLLVIVIRLSYYTIALSRKDCRSARVFELPVFSRAECTKWCAHVRLWRGSEFHLLGLEQDTREVRAGAFVGQTLQTRAAAALAGNA